MPDRFIALFEHMQEGAALHEVVCDAYGRPIDYRIVEMNDQFELHTGIRRIDAAGKLASEVYGTDVPPFLEEFCAVGLGGPAVRFETHFAPLDRYFSISVAPLGPMAFATIFSDITLAKKQAEALEKIRLSQRALLDNQPHLAWLKDREGRFLAVNQAFAAACGQPSPEAMVGKTDLDVWPRDLAEAYRADDAAVIGSGVQKAVEEEIAGADGLRWFETYKSPVYAPSGEIVGTTGVSRDISIRKQAELARAQSQRKFEIVFDLAPGPIAVSAMTGELLFVNRAFCTATGFAREELLGNRAVDLHLWEDPATRERAFSSLHTEGRFDGVRMTLVSKTGEKREFLMAGALIELDGSTGMITAARDITEHLRAERKAKQAAETLARFFALSVDLLCISNREGQFVRLNPAWTTVLGIPSSELEGRAFIELVHPDDRAATLQATADLASGRSIIDFQNRYRHADGRWRWIEWHSAPDENGFIYAVARDVTQRRADEAALRDAERALAASHEQLLSVSELAHIGHFTIDTETRESVWTAELYRIFGVDPEHFAPSVDSVSRMLHPGDAQAVAAAVREVVTTGEARRADFRLRRPSGEERFCLVIVERMESSVSPAVRVHGLVQDLTESRRAEEEQRRLEQQVMQAQKLESLGVLAGGIAHDFNNLLTGILGNADLAMSEVSPTSPIVPYLCDIEQASRHAADLCRQLLAYSGRGRFVVQHVSLNDVIGEMTHLLSASISKRVVLKYDLSKELPSTLADVTQVRQVVMNLITNASEAIGDESGIVAVSTGVMDCDEAYLRHAIGGSEQRQAGRYVFLEVADSGCGMDEDTLARMFDPFFTTKFTGRGLGLAAVLGIVRGHKGVLHLSSEKGRGTTFKILMPAHQQAPQPVEATVSVGAEWRGHGMVLLADDESSVRTVGRRLLERVGFEVLTASDGREAVELFRRHRDAVRLVVLDMTMPVLDGEGCFRELRDLAPDVKVIMSSGYNEQEVVERFAEKGLAGFVQKPYKAADLLPRIRAALGE